MTVTEQRTVVLFTPSQMQRIESSGCPEGTDIAEWLTQRVEADRASPCSCGPLRDEIVVPGDNLRIPRYGCKRCNKWDGPVRFWGRESV